LPGGREDDLSRSKPQLSHSHSLQAETNKSEIREPLISAPVEISIEAKEIGSKNSKGRPSKKRKARNAVLTIIDDDYSTNDDEGFDQKQKQVKHNNFHFIILNF